MVKMIEKYYIRIDEFKLNDFNYSSLLMNENKAFSYDIGNTNGTREQILNYITKRTIMRANAPKHIFHFKYQTLEDTKIMRKHLQEDEFYSYYKIEMTPSVFVIDEYPNEMLKDILNKHALQRRMFESNKYHQY
jgi:hypothetical protein